MVDVAEVQAGIGAAPGYDGREVFAREYMAHEGEHRYVRYAKAHCASWRESPIAIGTGERIVGVPRMPMVVCSSIAGGLEFNPWFAEHPLKTGTPEQQETVRSLRDTFSGKHVTMDLVREEAIRRGHPWHYSIGNGASFQGHMVVDYAKVLRIGIPGLRAEVEAAMATASPDKRPFYEALLLYCDNMAGICRRYASAASEVAETASDTRQAELAEIAEVCRAIESRTPRTFREAIQLFWFVFLLDGSDDPGRLDQYMYPFYRTDIDSGRITRDEAYGLLVELWCKMRQLSAWSLVLGGQTPDGEDASNELTELCLEVTELCRFTNPAIALRVHSRTPRPLWRRAMRVIARGGGMPGLVNDDAVVPAMVDSGVQIEDARDYAMGGCIEFQISGKSNFGGEDGQINLAKCLELALNDGRCALTGDRIGPSTGDPLLFRTFDEVLTAYKRQAEAAIDDIVAQCNIGQEMKGKYGVKLFRSLLVEDCIGRGLPCDCGGALYGNGQILTNGLIVTADSLAAIGHLVFTERSLSMQELIQALRDNWEGHEAIRQRIVNTAPRYGNDDERVDSIAHEVAEHLWSRLKGRRTHRGGRYTGLVVYFNRQVYFGRMTGATPDGRRSGEVIEDSIGPWPGRDTHGPTAMMRSATAIPQALAAGGVVLNLKLTPNCLSTDEEIEKSIDLIRSYFALGGQQVQVTVANLDDLRAAMREPEKWRHLIVRVGGYSDYFVNLDPQLQESIVQRTAY